MPRFFVPFNLEAGQDYRLPENVLHHLNVRRLMEKERISLFNGDGKVYFCQIQSLSRKQGYVKVLSVHEQCVESPLTITLAQGIASKDRMDYILQKGVELGVVAFQPLVTECSLPKMNPEREVRRISRWQDIVISACEQCGRNIIPVVYPVKTLGEYLETLPEMDACWVLSLAKNQSLKTITRVPKSLCLLTGPEGGLSVQEERLVIDRGFEPITLGPRVLRTETAAMAAVAAMQVLWGDF